MKTLQKISKNIFPFNHIMAFILLLNTCFINLSLNGKVISQSGDSDEVRKISNMENNYIDLGVKTFYCRKICRNL